jgi:hypothetical protein
MSKFVMKIIVLLFIFQITLSASEKLIFASVLFRHGDRTPTKALLNKKNAHNWKLGLGELTPEGMHQEYKLGEYLNDRYIKHFTLIPENYNSNKIYVRATDVNRTLMSAESLLYGFYPLGTGPLINNKTALPYRFQPVPIHSALTLNDKLLSSRMIYTHEVHKLQKKLVYNSKAWLNMQTGCQNYFKNWAVISGFKIDNLKDVKFLASNIFIREKHGIKQPKGLTNTGKDTLLKLASWIHAEQYKPQAIGMLISKDLIKQIIDTAKKSIKDKSACKLFLYSAHDTNILGLMSALGVPLDKNPHYASFMAIELYEINKKYFIKLIYNKKEVKLHLSNTDGYYPFNTFANYCNKVVQNVSPRRTIDN